MNNLVVSSARALGSSAEVRAEEVLEWDVGNWSGCLDYWAPWLYGLERSMAKVLVVGERDGGLSLWFACLGFNVICSGYRLAEDNARKLHCRRHVQGRVSYAMADVFRLPYSENQFDVVACKSVIGGLKLERKSTSSRTLENQKVAVAEIRRVLKPGGIFLGAENLRGSRLHQAFRRMRNNAETAWRHLQPGEIRWLFDRYSSCEQKTWGFLGTHWPGILGLNKITKAADGALSVVLPPSWLYISFIRARK